MKFTMRKLTMFLLVILAAFVLVGCDKDPVDPKDPDNPTPTDEVADVVVAKDDAVVADEEANEYTKESTEIYNANLGQFYSYYQQAQAEKNVSKKYALEAIAEAKLLESGLFVPLSSQGGSYAISRVAPYTVSPVLWGLDGDRYKTALVTTDFIKSEDRAAMKEKYSELKGSGTYYEWAKQYLTDQGYSFQKEYNLGYTSDGETWDVLATSRANDSEKICLTFDGLIEYDVENVAQPALASSYDVSADGKTYTFHIREGVKWVNYQGKEVGEVTADDWVAGLQHAFDAQGGLEYLVEGVIVNASEYIAGEVTDFSQVGVKAVDKYTLQYTLVDECSYFATMLNYGLFAPLCREYYVSQGGKFGSEFDDSAETYKYGKSPETIAYCGPYVVSENTAESTIKYTANASYWNAASIQNTTITMKYNDGTDVTKAYTDAKNNVIAGAGLSSAVLESAKQEKPAGQDKTYFELYGYVSGTDATTFSAFINVNRAAYANVSDASVVSPKTDAQKEASVKALSNVYFRLALCMSLDRGTYNAQSVGEELKYTNLRNSYTPGTFVSLTEDVTVEINGKAQTFVTGTNYGVILQAQLDADNVPIKAYDATADDGAGSSDGYDGWYNPTEAKKYFARALKELKAQGLEISASNPIYLDLPTYIGSDVYKNRGAAFAKSVAEVLGGCVVINNTECPKAANWYYAGYYTDYGYEANYDIYDVSGWGPDYGDPKTYLDTMLPSYSGYMTKCLGIY